MNKDKLIISGFFCMFFCSISYGKIHTVCMQDMESNFLSLSSLISCLCMVFVSKIWIDKSDFLYKKFGIMLILETILYAILVYLVLTGQIGSKVYYIVDTILFATITKSIICGGNRLKAIRYKGKEREKFDNKSSMYYSIANVLGYGVGAFFEINTFTAFLSMYIGLTIDNIFYFHAYKETKKEYAIERWDDGESS